VARDDEVEDLISKYAKGAERIYDSRSSGGSHTWLGLFGDFAYAIIDAVAQAEPEQGRQISKPLERGVTFPDPRGRTL
jgi:hypothetical protein